LLQKSTFFTHIERFYKIFHLLHYMIAQNKALSTQANCHLWGSPSKVVKCNRMITQIPRCGLNLQKRLQFLIPDCKNKIMARIVRVTVVFRDSDKFYYPEKSSSESELQSVITMWRGSRYCRVTVISG